MHSQFYSAIQDIGKDVWQAFEHHAYPFTRFEFLNALEQSNNKHTAACCTESGWQPHHLIIRDDNNEVVAGLPLYLKFHSYGEYIFDWAWADAYQRNGLEYYPKLLAAIPFTPCTGPRVLLAKGIEFDKVLPIILKVVAKESERLQLSSSHLLFNEQQVSEKLAKQGLMLRESVQYHWFNRSFLKAGEQSYNNFTDFLGSFKSRKRKAVNRERAQIKTEGLQIKRLRGEEITTEIWQQFFRFYQITYAKRSGHGGYLPQNFFLELASMPDQIMMTVAYRENESQVVAAALYFYSHEALYGRYWGCTEETEFLHFELCYYQGIEFCIENQLQRFDAGAQGEHKIQRGFIPVKTFSNHSITDPRFNEAITRFVKEERLHNSSYIKEVFRQLPYKEGVVAGIE